MCMNLDLYVKRRSLILNISRIADWVADSMNEPSFITLFDSPKIFALKTYHTPNSSSIFSPTSRVACENHDYRQNLIIFMLNKTVNDLHQKYSATCQNI